MTKETNQTMSEQGMSHDGVRLYQHRQDDGIDLIQLFLGLKKNWKQIFLIVFIGTVLSIAVALALPKIYEPSVQVSLPSIASSAKLDENGLKPYSQLKLFKEYYDKARSESFLRKFVDVNQYLEKLYPDKYSVEKTDELFATLAAGFTIKVDEPIVDKGKFVAEPTQFTLGLKHTNEPLLVEFLNNYLDYINDELITIIANEQSVERATRLTKLNREIKLLRENAKTVRQLTIDRKKAANAEEIEKLQQSKQLLVAKANQDRAIKINKLEEEIQQKINELEQSKSLLISRSLANRLTQIANATEAEQIARNLNIVHPTPLDRLNKGDSSAKDAATSITLSDKQELPLYLMGTKYLATLIKTLKARDEDAVFLTEINNIDSEIAKASNDQALKILKARESEAPFLEEINQIDQDIKRVENDVELKTLEERESDDPYIQMLPEKLNAVSALSSLSLTFKDVQAYSLDRAAVISKMSNKPNRKLIVIIGGLLSVFLALFFVAVKIATLQRVADGTLDES
jgi:LPS O-antigen subunit length determinant protein (WzzB/FepE family)